MRNELYQTAGEVNIPEKKKVEFNENILKLLYMGGIRKMEEMELDGKKVTVVSKPVPDENGIVRFDYSIFENYKREINTYDMNTCKLDAPDRGYQEFGIIMNAVMVMQEAFSEGSCYYMDEGKPGGVSVYASFIHSLTGLKLRFPGRSRIWDMRLFFHNSEEYKDVTGKDILDVYSWDYCDFSSEQFMAFLHLGRNLSAPDEPFEGGKADFAEASKYAVAYQIQEKIAQLVEKGESETLKSYLKRLLDLERKDRAALAAEDAAYGEIAEASLYLLPPMIVNAFAMATGQKFWETWDSMEITGYSDIMTEEKHKTDPGEEKDSIPFYEIIQREDEDEFIEYWGGQELKLSDEMKERFKDWAERFPKIIPDKNFDMEQLLAEIFAELEEYGNCRLADKQFVLDCMVHKEDENYQKALLLLKEIVEEDMEYFPELTRRQAIRWIMRECRNEFDYTEIAAFQSLIMNHKHRLEILGF